MLVNLKTSLNAVCNTFQNLREGRTKMRPSKLIEIKMAEKGSDEKSLNIVQLRNLMSVSNIESQL